MPVIDPRVFGELMAEVHTAMIAKRIVNHSVLETLAVVATIVFGVGGYMYYAIKVQSK
ncbi:hypothetical protein BD289DRAFT_197131 [Coniella lustricola]|uniref:Uncharacterized protein n=1 Tax=Coniella lustricola TaxID=2025994 RepID=A0A2T3ACS1_9PEZI|nr:hypothetical protein BD289DRAFT_197131 [Coniella lustricola]